MKDYDEGVTNRMLVLEREQNEQLTHRKKLGGGLSPDLAGLSLAVDVALVKRGEYDEELREKIAEELYYQHKSGFVSANVDRYRAEHKWWDELSDYKREFYVRADQILTLIKEITNGS